MRDLVVLGGSSHPSLTKAICRNLTIEQGVVKSVKFSNGETSIEVVDSVREKDVFIVQSGCGDVNDTFIELCIMIAACKTASAKRVTAVLPLFPYSRQADVPHAANNTGAPSISQRRIRTRLRVPHLHPGRYLVQHLRSRTTQLLLEVVAMAVTVLL